MADEQIDVKALTKRTEEAALTAALEELSKLGKEPSVGDYRRHILLAAHAVNTVRADAQALVDIRKDEYIYVDTLHIVATALWCRESGVYDELDDVHPYTIGAHPFLGFAKAILALEAMSNLQMVLSDVEDDILLDGYASDTLEYVTRVEDDEKARAAKARKKKTVPESPECV